MYGMLCGEQPRKVVKDVHINEMGSEGTVIENVEIYWLVGSGAILVKDDWVQL